jgi:hypothetical protein
MSALRQEPPFRSQTNLDSNMIALDEEDRIGSLIELRRLAKVAGASHKKEPAIWRRGSPFGENTGKVLRTSQHYELSFSRDNVGSGRRPPLMTSNPERSWKHETQRSAQPQILGLPL